MDERAPSRIGILRRVAKWAAISVGGVVALYLLFVIVVIVGAMLGLWPISDR